MEQCMANVNCWRFHALCGPTLCKQKNRQERFISSLRHVRDWLGAEMNGPSFMRAIVAGIASLIAAPSVAQVENGCFPRAPRSST